MTSEYWYVLENGDIKHVKDGKEEIVTKRKGNEPLLTIPLGYGVVAPAFGLVGPEPENEFGIKEGDLVLTYAKLPKKQEPGSKVAKEAREFAEAHPLVRFIITKEYAVRLASQLMEYAKGDLEKHE